MEQGLDYLEGRAPGLVLRSQEASSSTSISPSGSSSGSGSNPTPLSPSERAARLLAPAAARCLGRLLADAPAAFGARPRALLSSLLPLKCGSGEDGGGGTCGRFFLPVLSGALAAEDDGDGDDDGGGETQEERMASLSLDDGDAGAWLSAARKPEALLGLAATLAAACSEASSAATRRSGGEGGGSNESGSSSGSGDGEVAAAVAVLTGLLPRPCASYLPLRPVLIPALASWAASRLGKKKEDSGGEERKRRTKKNGGGGASASLLSTANEVARALALLLASSPPASSGPLLPPSAAAASSAALVACLRPGWAAWALRSKRKGKGKGKQKGSGGVFGGREQGGGEQEGGEEEHRNDFGPSAAPMEDASHLEAGEGDDDPVSLMESLRREVGLEQGVGGEEDEEEGLRRFDERGWSRALRAASLVVAASAAGAEAEADAFVAAASSAPWLKELLLQEEEGGGEVVGPSDAALRAFVGALRSKVLSVGFVEEAE